jgi:hypothetical protein
MTAIILSLRALWPGVLLTLAVALGSSASAQPLAPGQVWRYTLLEGSILVDDCPICARPTVAEPMRGTFELALVEETPLFSRYELRDILFTAGRPGGRIYRVVGSGIWTIAGEVALRQEMTLTVGIDDGFLAKTCFFTNEDTSVTRVWPMMAIDLLQTNGTLTQTYSVTVIAAPVREMWFSTTVAFTSANEPGLGLIEPGDLLSIEGHMVKRNRQLTASLGIQPTETDYGLDAVDVIPGGEILFSMNEDVFSERLGLIRHGDLVSAKGNVRQTNSELLAAFDPQSTADAGLDAIQVRPESEIWFSIRSNIVSAKTGGLLRRGDLLSSKGVVVRTQEQLLSRFHPAVAKDYGLDALYGWENGEIWFSTEDDFQDQQLGPIAAGDLLSDAGAVVFRNRDFVSRFAPQEQIADYGLDGLFLVTDTFAEPTPPRITKLTVEQQSPRRLEWTGNGRVFQIEEIPRLGGPAIESPSPIIPDFSFDFPVINRIDNQLFYRLRQW